MRKLDWKPVKPNAIANVEDLLLKGVCQVRHNLVHGGKFLGSAEEWERSVKLIGEATWVLAEIAKRRPDLKM